MTNDLCTVGQAIMLRAVNEILDPAVRTPMTTPHVMAEHVYDCSGCRMSLIILATFRMIDDMVDSENARRQEDIAHA